MIAENCVYVLLITAVINKPSASPYTIFCSGTLIREDLALTAAHCFKYRIKHLKEVKIFLLSGMVRYVEPRDIHIHPKHNADDFCDVAVLQFPSTQIDKLKCPKLPDKKEKVPLQTCFTAGFGYYSPDLEKFKKITLNETQMFPMDTCIAVVFEKPTPCKGDSGGPLICNQTLIGVLSKGTSQTCSDTSALMVYESTLCHLDWIKSYFKLAIAPPPMSVYFILFLVATVIFIVCFSVFFLYMFFK